MRALGVIRNIDNLGRIVIPAELRRKYKLEKDSPVELFIGDKGEIILKPCVSKKDIFADKLTRELLKGKFNKKQDIMKLIDSTYSDVFDNTD